jgi:Type VI secretion system effector, Hcp
MRDCNDAEFSGVALTDEELSTVSAGKSDGFLHIGDIQGESTDKGHKDSIEILSWS